jgi:hypothetical protein
MAVDVPKPKNFSRPPPRVELNDTCDRCGKTDEGIGWIARGYRLMRLKRGHPDPGNLCGACAGSETGKEIGARLASLN